MKGWKREDMLLNSFSWSSYVEEAQAQSVEEGVIDDRTYMMFTLSDHSV